MVAALLAAWLATWPTTITGLILAVATGAVVLLKLDPWRRVLAVAVALLYGATSSSESIAAASYYPRFVAVGLLAVWTWRYRERRLKECPLIVRQLMTGLWLAAGFAVLSLTWSVDRTATTLQAAVLGLLTAIVHGLVVGRWHRGEVVAQDLAVIVLIFSGIFTAGLVLDLAGATDLTRGFGDRYFGLFNNPNTVGSLAALLLPLSIGIWRSTRNHLYLLAVAPIAVAVPYSLSRTAILALLAGSAWILLRSGPGRFLKTGLTVAAVGTVGFVLAPLLNPQVPGVVGQLQRRFTAQEGGDLLNTRTFAWRAVGDAISRRPIEGYGYGAGPTLFESLKQSGRLVFGSDVAHNSYLQWLLELGILGMIPLVVLLFVCFRVMTRGRFDSLGAGLVCTVVTGLAIQMTESSMFGIGAPYPYIFWLAVAAAAAGSTTGRSAPEDPALPPVELRRRPLSTGPEQRPGPSG